MLSQAEIDALLAGTIEIDSHDGSEHVNLADVINQTAGGPPEPAANIHKQATDSQKQKVEDRNIKPYNFWSPDRFSKEQIRVIEMIHDDLAERLTASLPSYLRSSARPRVVHIEQGRFHDFLQDLSPDSLFHLINLAPLPGQVVLTISPELSYSILELLLGGRTFKARGQRSLTEIDQLLLKGIVEHMLNDLKVCWNRLVAVEPGLDETAVNYHWAQMVMGNERVMLVAFELALQSSTGTMNIYIPFTMLKPIASVLNPYLLISNSKEKVPNPDEQQVIIDNLSQVALAMKVILGRANLRISELSSLKPGDVIQLDRSIYQDLSIQVADRTRFLARVGRVGNHLAAQVTAVLEQTSAESLER